MLFIPLSLNILFVTLQNHQNPLLGIKVWPQRTTKIADRRIIINLKKFSKLATTIPRIKLFIVNSLSKYFTTKFNLNRTKTLMPLLLKASVKPFWVTQNWYLSNREVEVDIGTYHWRRLWGKKTLLYYVAHAVNIIESNWTFRGLRSYLRTAYNIQVRLYIHKKNFNINNLAPLSHKHFENNFLIKNSKI